MWTRSELKSKAKVAFKANYWKSVLVAILLSILLGVGMGTARGQFRSGGQEAEPIGIEQVGIEETAVPEPEPMSSEDARALLIVTPLLLLIVLVVIWRFGLFKPVLRHHYDNYGKTGPRQPRNMAKHVQGHASGNEALADAAEGNADGSGQ